MLARDLGTCQCACMASGHSGRRAAGLMRHRAKSRSLVEQQLSSNLNEETHMTMLTIPIIISVIRTFKAPALPCGRP